MAWQSLRPGGKRNGGRGNAYCPDRGRAAKLRLQHPLAHPEGSLHEPFGDSLTLLHNFPLGRRPGI